MNLNKFRQFLLTICGLIAVSAYLLIPTHAQTAMKIAKSLSGDRIGMGGVVGSCWMSSNELIFWNGHQLVKSRVDTGQQTPIQGSEDAYSGEYWSSEATGHLVSLSPDGHWIVWAGHVDGCPAWVALSTDGTERRQWPRAEFRSNPAIAWMQDNKHWVELSAPEQRTLSTDWRASPGTMRARVYSIDNPAIQDFPLQLEPFNPGFFLPTNFGRASEFLFTANGHAWLDQNWESNSFPETNDCSREDVYELIPSTTVWRLHKTVIYPKTDQDHCVFDQPKRSPDGKWIVWRSYYLNDVDHCRLMLSLADGSEMRMIYQGDTIAEGQAEWSPNSRQIAFTDNGVLGIRMITLDDFIAKKMPKVLQGQMLAHALVTGSFPVSHVNLKSLSHPLVAAQR